VFFFFFFSDENIIYYLLYKNYAMHVRRKMITYIHILSHRPEGIKKSCAVGP